MGKPVKTSITIGDHKQQLLYKGKRILCKNYGCLGHIAISCPEKRPHPVLATSSSTISEDSPALVVDPCKEWKTISFRKRFGKKPSDLSLHRIRQDRGNDAPIPAPGKSPNSLSLEAVASMNVDNTPQLGLPNSVGPSRVINVTGLLQCQLGQLASSTNVNTHGLDYNLNKLPPSSPLGLNLKPSLSLGPTPPTIRTLTLGHDELGPFSPSEPVINSTHDKLSKYPSSNYNSHYFPSISNTEKKKDLPHGTHPSSNDYYPSAS